LSELGIRTVYDLRDLGERTSLRTVWAAGPVNVLASGKETTDMSAAAKLSSPDMTAAAARAVLAEFYGKMPRLYAPEYKAIFHELLEGHTPLLLHCTGGKDRTGLGSALILASLDVPRATIDQDYELTDRLLIPSKIPATTPFMQRMTTMPPEVQQAMIRADPAYLDAAFKSIDEQYGSLGQYLQIELGVGPHERDRLRALLLH
jgi:protein-tyrosine phosphatase